MAQLCPKTCFLLILTTFLLFNHTCGIKKIWKGSTTFEDRKSWENNKNPSQNCSTQIIKFPSKLYTSVQLTNNIAASQIILSEDGGLLLGSDTTISLSDSVSSEIGQSCKAEAVFAKPEPRKWFSVESWEHVFEDGDQLYNKATPDTHRIPCEDDTVVFPNDTTILVDLHFAPALNFREVDINGQTYKQEFEAFVRTDLGSSMFLNSEATSFNVGGCSERKNCICEHQDFLCGEVDCDKDKRGAFCVDPIKPSGFCCDICGSYISIVAVDPDTFDLKRFIRSIEQTLSFSKLNRESVEYYVTFTYKYSLQLVIVDKVEGNEMSEKVMNYLRKNLIEKMFKDSVKIYKQSGRFVSPGSISVFLLLFLTLVTVSALLAVFYVYHYENQAIPRLFAMVRTRQFPTSQFIFARFDNRERHEDGLVEIEVVPEEDEPEEKPSSFNNPLYEDKMNLNEVSEGSSTAEETELTETTKETPNPEVTFDEVDLLGPHEE